MSINNNKILYIITGGTIDARAYEETPKITTSLENSIIPKTLDELGLIDDINIRTWDNKDSKLYDKADIFRLAQEITGAGEDKIIITHGTDHMAENARYLDYFLREMGVDKTVIFTGAMVPIMNEISHGEKSDGFENLRFAHSQAEQLCEGTYIAFAGKVLDPHHTRKNFDKKEFYEVAEKLPFV